MPISFACGCGKTFTVADQYAGKRTKCTACGQPVVVPTPAPTPAADEPADEDAAFRALSEGPDPEPAPRSTGRFAGAAPSAPWRATSPLTAGETTSNKLGRTAEVPRPKPSPPPAYRPTSDSPPKRKSSPDWVRVGGGVAMGVVGLVWLLGSLGAWAAGLGPPRLFIAFPIALVGASPFFVIDGFRERVKK